MFGTALSVLGKVLMSMGARLLTAEFFEWAILFAAKKYVESTETKADDEWYVKVEKMMEEGRG